MEENREAEDQKAHELFDSYKNSLKGWEKEIKPMKFLRSFAEQNTEVETQRGFSDSNWLLQNRRWIAPLQLENCFFESSNLKTLIKIMRVSFKRKLEVKGSLFHSTCHWQLIFQIIIWIENHQFFASKIWFLKIKEISSISKFFNYNHLEYLKIFLQEICSAYSFNWLFLHSKINLLPESNLLNLFLQYFFL